MTTRKIVINDNIYYFNFDIFNDLFVNKCKNEKMLKCDLEYNLSEYVNKSTASIHNWRFKLNGTSDLDTIKLIANFFEISDYKVLSNEKEKEYLMGKFNDLQMLSLKKYIMQLLII